MRLVSWPVDVKLKYKVVVQVPRPVQISEWRKWETLAKTWGEGILNDVHLGSSPSSDTNMEGTVKVANWVWTPGAHPCVGFDYSIFRLTHPRGPVMWWVIKKLKRDSWIGKHNWYCTALERRLSFVAWEFESPSIRCVYSDNGQHARLWFWRWRFNSAYTPFI